MVHPARILIPLFVLAFGTVMAIAIRLQIRIWEFTP